MVYPGLWAEKDSEAKSGSVEGPLLISNIYRAYRMGVTRRGTRAHPLAAPGEGPAGNSTGALAAEVNLSGTRCAPSAILGGYGIFVLSCLSCGKILITNMLSPNHS